MWFKSPIPKSLSVASTEVPKHLSGWQGKTLQGFPLFFNPQKGLSPANVLFKKNAKKYMMYVDSCLWWRHPRRGGTVVTFAHCVSVFFWGVGGCNSVLLPAFSATRSCYVVTSSSSNCQDVPDTLEHVLQVTSKTLLIRCNIFFK